MKKIINNADDTVMEGLEGFVACYQAAIANIMNSTRKSRVLFLRTGEKTKWRSWSAEEADMNRCSRDL